MVHDVFLFQGILPNKRLKKKLKKEYDVLKIIKYGYKPVKVKSF